MRLLTPEKITGDFGGARHRGQHATAEYLLAHGADLNWIGWDGLTPLDAAERHDATDLAKWLRARGARSAKDLNRNQQTDAVLSMLGCPRFRGVG